MGFVVRGFKLPAWWRRTRNLRNCVMNELAIYVPLTGVYERFPVCMEADPYLTRSKCARNGKPDGQKPAGNKDSD